MEISKIEAIGFDWDGTLVDSIGVKSQSFAELVIVFYPVLAGKQDKIMAMYIATKGSTRAYQLELVQKKYNLKKLSTEETKKWSDLFTSLYIDKKPPLFNDTIKVLDKLKVRGYKLFLSSSVPQEYLDRTLELYPLENYFEVVLGLGGDGKFRKGIPHFTHVSKTIRVPLDKIAFIGDARDDILGAKEAGCFSIGKLDSRIPNSKQEIQENSPNLIINNLEELLIYFV